MGCINMGDGAAWRAREGAIVEWRDVSRASHSLPLSIVVGMTMVSCSPPDGCTRVGVGLSPDGCAPAWAFVVPPPCARVWLGLCRRWPCLCVVTHAPPSGPPPLPTRVLLEGTTRSGSGSRPCGRGLRVPHTVTGW